MVTLRLLIDRPLPRSIWIPGSLLSVASLVFPLAYSLAVDAANWLDLPVLAVWYIFMLYCAAILAQLTLVRQYGYVVVIGLTSGALFRYLTYRVVGPLYADTEEAKGSYSIVDVYGNAQAVLMFSVACVALAVCDSGDHQRVSSSPNCADHVWCSTVPASSGRDE